MKSIVVFLFSFLFFLNFAHGEPLTDQNRAEFPTKNYLADKNPGFENGKAGWTASGGTFTTVTSGSNFMGIGKANATWDSSGAAQTLTSKAFTIPNGLAGTNGLMRCKTMNPSATTTTTMGVWDGTTLTQQTTIAASALAKFVDIPFIFGAATTTVAIRFTAVAADEPIISIDDCYIGTNFNIGDLTPITDWVSYTPTFVGFGTATSINFKSRRVGSNLEVKGAFTTGTTTAVANSITIGYNGSNGNVLVDVTASPPSSLCGIGGQAATAATFFGLYVLTPSSSQNLVNLSRQDSASNDAVLAGLGTITGSSILVNVQFSVPIAGWSNQSAVRVDQSNFGWTAYTPTFTGIGTATNVSYFYRRNGQMLEVRGTHTNGTVAASLWSMSLPSSLVIDTSAVSINNTTSNPGMQLGQQIDNGSTTSISNIVTATATSTSLVYSGSPLGSSAKLTPTNGSVTNVSSASVSIMFSVPISGWNENQRAPLLVGSVTQPGGGIEKLIRGTVLASACTLVRGSPGVTLSGSSAGAGCTITFDSGLFSAPPSCVFTSSTGNGCANSNTNLITSTVAKFINEACSTATGINTGEIYFMCMGPN